MLRKRFYSVLIGLVPVLGFVDSSRAGVQFMNQSWSVYLGAGIAGRTSMEFKPPAGQILIVDFVSSQAWCPEGQKITIYATVLNTDRTEDVEHAFVVNDLGVFPDGGNPRRRFAVSQPTTIYVRDGGTIYFSAVRSANEEGTCPVSGGFSGRYVDSK
jgi:hypothetical protein